MTPRSRRALLQTVAAGATGLLAGCQDGPTDVDDAPTGTDGPDASPAAFPTPTTTDAAAAGARCGDRWAATERWRHETGLRAYAPTVVDGAVYFGAQDGHLRALDAASGAVRWTRERTLRLYARPRVVDGLVVAPGYDSLTGHDVSSGETRWSHAPPGRHGQVDTRLAVDGRRLFFGASNRAGTQEAPAETPYERLYAIDAGADEPAWYRPTGQSGGSSGIAAADGIVYRASSDGVLYALDAASGETVWKRSVAGDQAAFDPRLGPDAVFVQESGELVAVDRADGTVRWRDDGAYRDDPAVGAAGVYCLAGRALVALDAATGERRWTVALPAADATALDVAGRTVYLSVPAADGSATLAVDAATGCLRGRFQVAARRTTRVARTDETVYLGGLHGDGALYAVARP